jgi:hypothetical protein
VGGDHLAGRRGIEVRQDRWMKGKGEKDSHPQANIFWSLGRRGIPKGR